MKLIDRILKKKIKLSDEEKRYIELYRDIKKDRAFEVEEMEKVLKYLLKIESIDEVTIITFCKLHHNCLEKTIKQSIERIKKENHIKKYGKPIR